MAHTVSGASLLGIYERLNKAARYKPMEANTYADWSVEAGDTVTITRDGEASESPVFSSTLTWKKGQQVELSSTGNRARTAVSKVSQHRYNSGASGLRNSAQMYIFDVNQQHLLYEVYDSEGRLSLLEVTVAGLFHEVYDTEGRFSLLMNTVDGLHHEVYDTDGRFSTLSNTVEGLRHEVYDTNGRYATLSNTVEGLRHEVYDTDGRFSMLQNTVEGLRHEVYDTNGRYATLSNTVEGLRHEVYDTNGRYSTLSNTVEGLRHEVYDTNGRYATLSNTVEGLRHEVYDTNGKYATLSNTVEGLRHEVYDTNGKYATLSNTVEGLRHEVYDTNGKYATLSNTVEGLRHEVYDTNGRYATLNATVTGLRHEVYDTNGSFATLQNTVTGLESEVSTMDGTVSTLSNTVNGFSTRISKVVDNSNPPKILAAEISTAINESGSQVYIEADHIRLNGQTLVSEMLTGQAVIAALKADSLQIKPQDGMSYLNVANCINTAIVQNNVLKLYNMKGEEVVSFSKAVPRSGTWSSGKLVITAPEDQAWKVGFDSGNDTVLGLQLNGTPTIHPDLDKWMLATVNVSSLSGSAGSETWTTRYSADIAVNATPVYNAVTVDSVQPLSTYPSIGDLATRPSVILQGTASNGNSGGNTTFTMTLGKYDSQTKDCVNLMQGDTIVGRLEIDGGGGYDTVPPPIVSLQTRAAGSVGGVSGEAYILRSDGTTKASTPISLTMDTETTTDGSSQTYRYVVVKEGSAVKGRISVDSIWNNGGKTAFISSVAQGMATGLVRDLSGYDTVYAIVPGYVNASGANTDNTAYTVYYRTPPDRYNTGWSDAYGKINLPNSENTGDAQLKISTPNVNPGTAAADVTTYTVTADATNAYIRRGATTVAQYTHNQYSAGQTNGQNSVTIQKGTWSNGVVKFTKSAGTQDEKSVTLTAGQPTWSGNNVALPILDGGNATGLTISMDVSDRYTAGQTAGRNEVNINKGTWTNGVIKFTKSVGTQDEKSVTLSKGTETWNGNNVAFPIKDGDTATGLTISMDVSARYTAGQTAGRNEVTITKGTWSNGVIKFTKSVGTQDEKSVSLNMGDETWSGNNVAVPVRDGTTATGLTVSINASARYTAGQTYGRNEVTITKGTWSNGVIKFTKSVGTQDEKSVSLNMGDETWGGNNVAVPVRDGTTATGLTVSVNAKRRYDAGWGAAYGRITIPTTSNTSSSFYIFTPPQEVDGTTVSTPYIISTDDDYAYLKTGSTTVARVSNGAYANGWKAAGAASGWSVADNESYMTFVWPQSTAMGTNTRSFYPYIRNNGITSSGSGASKTYKVKAEITQNNGGTTWAWTEKDITSVYKDGYDTGKAAGGSVDASFSVAGANWTTSPSSVGGTVYNISSSTSIKSAINSKWGQPNTYIYVRVKVGSSYKVIYWST